MFMMMYFIADAALMFSTKTISAKFDVNNRIVRWQPRAYSGVENIYLVTVDFTEISPATRDCAYVAYSN